MEILKAHKPKFLVDIGDRIRFEEEAQAYTIQARSQRFIICTKPFNCRRSVLYTIVDLEKHIRGVDNLIFSMGYETKAQCFIALKELDKGAMCVSTRNHIPLNISTITGKAGTKWL